MIRNIPPRPTEGMNPSRGYSQGYPPSSFQQSQQQPPQLLQNGTSNQPQLPQQQGTSSDAQSNSAGGPGAEMNLASVLHYLQSEWRRWERDRNEWEIERAEMRVGNGSGIRADEQARIALLEGQRRSAENLKVDLMRRVKMLEFAIRQERTKNFGTAGRSAAPPPARLVALQDEDRSIRDEKEEGGSEGSEEGASERPKPNGIHTAMSKAAILSSRKEADTSAWKTVGGAPRDPKSRARSRDYLKQCLQEITYLTSPGALNPLPPRPPISVNDPSSPVADNGSLQEQETHPDPSASLRPRKALPDQPVPSIFNKHETPSESLPNGVKEEPIEPSPVAPEPQDAPKSHPMSIDTTARPPSSPAVRTMNLPDEQSQENEAPEQPILTAIYRPDSKAAWREELRAANEKAEKARDERLKASDQSDEEQLANLTLNVEDEEVKPDDNVERVWSSRRSLKSHLDVVRAVAFAQGHGITLATGGDDNTVKVWSMETSSIMSQKPSATDIEPVLTLRGHTSSITALAISTSLSTIFSASLDSTIRLWRLPSPTQDSYAPFDPSFALQVLEGHTEAVWDVCLLPPREAVQPGKRPTEGRLVSASADGTVKIWTMSNSNWSLQSSFGDFGGGVVPTCLSLYSLDLGKVLVGLSSGLVKLYDVNSVEEVLSFGEASEDGQVNSVMSHPTLPAILSAHEDGHLRFYDAKTSSSQPTHTILAHPSPLTSLSISPLSPLAVFTASTDCTLRLWDLSRKTSLQDLLGHRKRADEGVCAVASHPELPVLASAGADGVVRLWCAG